MKHQPRYIAVPNGKGKVVAIPISQPAGQKSAQKKNTKTVILLAFTTWFILSTIIAVVILAIS